MSRITDIAKTMKTWWNEDDDPFVHCALDEIIRIDQEQLSTIESKRGEWLEWIDCEGEVFWKCSACGQASEASAAGILYKFCPFCGVRMKGADNEASD